MSLPDEITINGARYVRASTPTPAASSASPGHLMTPAEVAEALGISRWQAYQLIRGDEPVIPYVQVGPRGKRVRRADVLAYIEANRHG